MAAKTIYAAGLDAGSRTTRMVICVLEDGRLRVVGCAAAESQGWIKGKIADQRAVTDTILAALREAARRRPVRAHRRRQQSARVPQLQLPRAQPGQRRNFAGGVRLLQAHRSAIAAPSKSFVVSPPSLCVEYVSVTRL